MDIVKAFDIKNINLNVADFPEKMREDILYFKNKYDMTLSESARLAIYFNYYNIEREDN